MASAIPSLSYLSVHLYCKVTIPVVIMTSFQQVRSKNYEAPALVSGCFIDIIITYFSIDMPSSTHLLVPHDAE